MEDELNIGIGTKETAALEPSKVKVQSVRVEMQKDKTGKEVGKKVILRCKHPAKDDPIEISSVKFEKLNKIQVTGLWYKQDEDKLIPKQSALAIMLKHYGKKTLKEIEGAELDTVKDENGYLCIKAY